MHRSDVVTYAARNAAAASRVCRTARGRLLAALVIVVVIVVLPVLAVLVVLAFVAILWRRARYDISRVSAIHSTHAQVACGPRA